MRLRVLCGLTLAAIFLTGGAHAFAQTAATSSAGAATKYRLMYKFEPGQLVHYEVSQKMSIRTQFGDAEETDTNESVSRKHFKVLKVDAEGNAELEPVIDEVRMSARFGGLDPIVFDSQNPDSAPPQFRDVKESLGKRIARLTFGLTGALKKVESLDPNVKIAQNDQKYSFLTVLPAEPVAIGGTWTDRFEVPVKVNNVLNQNMALQRTYQLTDVKGSLAIISSRVAVLTPVTDPQVELQLIQRKPVGVIEFDMERGLLVSVTTKLDEQVIGAFGPKSATTHKCETREKLIIPGPRENAQGDNKSST